MKKKENPIQPPKYRKPRKGKWVIIITTLVLGFAALWTINSFASQIRKSEQEKVRIWASAISQKAELVSSTETFFNEVGIDERRKVKLYIDVLQSFNKHDLSSDAEFYLSYVSYIVDSSRTPFMILDKDSLITSCGNIMPTPAEDRTLIGQKASPQLLSDFSHNPPFEYDVWGIPLTLMYKESQIYTDMRSMLDNLNRSFLSEVTNNSVFVPVIVVDSTRKNVLGAGNINNSDFNTPEKLQDKLDEMAGENDPIALQLANHRLAYVYYEPTPLLKMLRIIPIFYLFIAIVLLLISYNLFRTARSDEENRIWVGMAKETAHQLGTPISSLSGWADYLEGKTPEKEQIKVVPEEQRDTTRNIMFEFEYYYPSSRNKGTSKDVIVPDILVFSDGNSKTKSFLAKAKMNTGKKTVKMDKILKGVCFSTSDIYEDGLETKVTVGVQYDKEYTYAKLQ